MLNKVARTYYQQPRFPDYPYSEWEARIAKAQELMAKNGADCLVVWERENNRYFFGFQTIHWFLKSLQPAVGIIPVDGEPILVVPALFHGNAEGLCWIKDLRIQLNPHQPKSQRELPIEIAEVLKEIGCGSKRIALEMGPLGCTWIPRPLNDIEAFKAALPDAKFVDGDKIIWGCRMIKSALEIDRIGKSINAVAAVQAAIAEGYRPGMSEIDLMKVINHARADQEGMGLGDDAVSLAHYSACPDGASIIDLMALEGAQTSKDYAIQFDGFCPYKGYVPDSCRIFQTSPVTDSIRKYYDVLFEAEDRAEALLRPGVTAKEVNDGMYQIVIDAGYQPLDMGGHGTGLTTHEPPSIDAWNEQVIEEGMVLSIEPWFSIKNGGIFGIQDTYVVTKTGCYKINGLRRDIIQVSHPFC